MKHILMVAAELPMYVTVQHWLEERYHVQRAVSGKEGLKELKHINPEVILLVWELPDSRDTLKMLRINEQWKKIPVVVLSEHASSLERMILCMCHMCRLCYTAGLGRPSP